MKWVRPSQATIDYFERLAPGPPLETRRMFGMPSRFLHGYMLVGLFGDNLILHLSPVDRAACIRAGAKRFKPMGRDMRGYVAIKPRTFTDHDLKSWIVRGMRHLATLPPRITEEPPAPARRSRARSRATTATTTKKKRAAAKPAKAKSVKVARKAKTKPKKKAARPRPAPSTKRPAPKKRRSKR